MKDFLLKLSILAFFSMACCAAFAELRRSEYERSDRTRILLGYGGNRPIWDSVRLFDYGPSIFHPIVGVRYFMNSWVLGADVHFKFFQDEEDGTRLVLWTLEEEINYRIRLYHPFYLLLGWKFLYLYPVERGKYPFRKRTDLNGAEVGVGLTSSLVYEFPKNIALGVYVDAWRGSGSRRYEGVEYGAHLMLPLPF